MQNIKANAEHWGIKDTSSTEKTSLWENGYNRLLKQFWNEYIEDI